MLITKVEVQKNNKDKCNLYIDDEFNAGVHLDVCIKYGLKAGKEISQEDIDEIIFESDKILALSKTTQYLNTALKTEKQIRDYIYKKGYSKEVCSFVISKLKEYNYINDENYARAYIETYNKKYGTLKLKTNLVQKGINKEIIENLLNDLETDDEILYNMAIKYMKNKENTYENHVKLMRFLAGRGFSFEDINGVIEKIKKGEIC